MKVKLPLQSKLAHARTLRLLGLASAVCLSLSAMLTQAATPPNPLVEFRFPEGIDVVTTENNTGTLAENAFFVVTDTNNYPGFSTNVPVGTYVPAANSYSVDMGPFVAGTYGRSVDLTNIFYNLGPLPALTICGWLNARDIPRNRRSSLCAGDGRRAGF